MEVVENTRDLSSVEAKQSEYVGRCGEVIVIRCVWGFETAHGAKIGEELASLYIFQHQI